MQKKFIAAAFSCAALLLSACVEISDAAGDWASTGTNTIGHVAKQNILIGALAVATPPLNTFAFGPCKEEFGMPDYRRANCEIYYRLRGATAPWQQREAAAMDATYAPGELRCWRTLGGVAECEPVGVLRKPPNFVTPNNLAAD